MPAGSVALLQLAAYGAESQYLTGNPQMTYFKLVFRRYTNFALDSREMLLTGPTTLLGEESITLKTVIPRHGDLLSALYVLVDLPDIYSGYLDNSNQPNVPDVGYRFQWIQELGARMIERVEITVGGTKVHELWGDWMYLWYEMYATDSVDLQTYDEMIGNVPEFHDPAHSVGRLGIYPTATLEATLNQDPELETSSTNKDVTNPYFRTSSIRGRTLYIPIPFWFGTHSGLSLPLIALQAHEVEVTVTLRRLNDLYTIVDPMPNSSTFSQRIRPSNERSDMHISHFMANVRRDGFGGNPLTNQSFARIATDTNINKLNVNPRLQGTYVLLDKEERKRFAGVSHEYLIEQVVRREFLGVHGEQLLDLTLSHPIKTLTWYAQHSDVDKTNDWCNYRNWRRHDPDFPNTRVALSGNGGQRCSYGRSGADIPPYTLQAFQPSADEVLQRRLADGVSTVDLSHQWIRTRDATQRMQLTRFDYPRTEPDILVSAGLLFNGNARIEVSPAPQFTHLEVLQHRLRRRRPGVYTYSFSLEPRHHQPAGACNMSRIQNVQLDVQTLSYALTDTENVLDFKVVVYAVNYNIFRILGGMGSLAFQNG